MKVVQITKDEIINHLFDKRIFIIRFGNNGRPTIRSIDSVKIEALKDEEAIYIRIES